MEYVISIFITNKNNQKALLFRFSEISDKEKYLFVSGFFDEFYINSYEDGLLIVDGFSYLDESSSFAVGDVFEKIRTRIINAIKSCTYEGTRKKE